MRRNQMTHTFIVAALLLGANGTALAGQGLYLDGALGIATLRDAQLSDSKMPGSSATASFDNGISTNLAAGYDFGGPRVELEWSYRKNNLSSVSAPNQGTTSASGKAESQALLLNGYYAFHNESALTPFVMAGIGYSKVKISNVQVNVPANVALPTTLPINSNYNDNVMAWQFGAGVSSALSDRMTLDLSWRYFQTSKPKSGTSTAEYSGQSMLAGVRYAF